MLRILPLSLSLSLLVACTEVEPAFERADEVASWLERWEAFRACVVSPLGDTVADGIAVAMLQGADCDRPIADFVGQVPLDEKAKTRWRRIAVALRDPSPQTRAWGVEAADVESLVLRMRLGIPAIAHPRTPLPRLKAEELTVGGKRLGRPTASFNGGRVTGAGTGFTFEIQSPHRGTSWVSGRIDPAYPSGRWRVLDVPYDHAFLAADHGETRLGVGRVEGSAYALSISRDGGRRWERSVFAPGLRLIDDYQDWSTGEIDLLVGGTGRSVYRHTISPSDPQPRIVELGPIERLGAIACRHGGHVWRVVDDHLLHIGPSRVTQHDVGASSVIWKVDCHDDRALVLRQSLEPDVLRRCGWGCNDVFRSPSTIHGVSALVRNKWIYAASREGVVAIHREGQGERLYRLPSHHQLVAITVLEDVPYLVLDEETSYSLVAIP